MRRRSFFGVLTAAWAALTMRLRASGDALTKNAEPWRRSMSFGANGRVLTEVRAIRPIRAGDPVCVGTGTILGFATDDLAVGQYGFVEVCPPGSVPVRTNQRMRELYKKFDA